MRYRVDATSKEQPGIFYNGVYYFNGEEVQLSTGEKPSKYMKPIGGQGEAVAKAPKKPAKKTAKSGPKNPASSESAPAESSSQE